MLIKEIGIFNQAHAEGAEAKVDNITDDYQRYCFYDVFIRSKSSQGKQLLRVSHSSAAPSFPADMIFGDFASQQKTAAVSLHHLRQLVKEVLASWQPED